LWPQYALLDWPEELSIGGEVLAKHLGARTRGARGPQAEFLHKDVRGGREEHAQLIRPEAPAGATVIATVTACHGDCHGEIDGV
jgi:hypothetical protein